MKACPRCNARYPQEATYCFVDGAELAPMRDPLIGATIGGRYVIESHLGEGGMATVYRARYKLVDRPCAIKMLNPSLATEANVRERFRREAKSVQAITHPNVIEIFDQGEADGVPFIVMELLEGQTLSALLQDGPLATARAVPVMIQIARGIARAHDLGVVHRDLKPENIFVCPALDGGDHVKILDFGIARSQSDTRLTSAGELFGTPQYMAPERVMSGEAGPSVDLYALGVIFFEMATARLPFEASDPPSFLIMHMKEPPPAPRSYNPRVHERVEALVLQLLEKDPRARPVDAHRVEQELVALARATGARVPPDADVDPASSTRPPARVQPSAMTGQWRRRVELFEQMASRAYGTRVPKDQESALAELGKLVREIDEVRGASAQEQRVLEEIDARGREGRQRLGFAVDALGLDASNAREDARTRRAVLGELTQSRAAMAEGYRSAQEELLAWEGRSALSEPYPQLAQAHRACAAAVDSWLAARTREREALAAAEGRDRTVQDLEYQIAQLRAALANHEAGIDRDRAAARQRVVDLNARAERIERRLVQLATQFCAPLRARPELGPLFQSLEASA